MDSTQKTFEDQLESQIVGIEGRMSNGNQAKYQNVNSNDQVIIFHHAKS